MTHQQIHHNTTSRQKGGAIVYILVFAAILVLIFLFIYTKSKQQKIDREEILQEIHTVRTQDPQVEVSPEEKIEIYNQIKSLNKN